MKLNSEMYERLEWLIRSSLTDALHLKDKQLQAQLAKERDDHIATLAPKLTSNQKQLIAMYKVAQSELLAAKDKAQMLGDKLRGNGIDTATLLRVPEKYDYSKEPDHIEKLKLELRKVDEQRQKAHNETRTIMLKMILLDSKDALALLAEHGIKI